MGGALAEPIAFTVNRERCIKKGGFRKRSSHPTKGFSRCGAIVFGQFLRFGLVGLSGFVVDTATVYALRGTTGLYIAGIVAYVLAATSNWALNRSWTFAGAMPAPVIKQWFQYMLANGIGFIVNRGLYAVCIWRLPIAAQQPVIALAAGTAAGMIVNFLLARKVFTSLPAPPASELMALPLRGEPAPIPEPELPRVPGFSSSPPSSE
jgi:putative flippase GtrA